MENLIRFAESNRTQDIVNMVTTIAQLYDINKFSYYYINELESYIEYRIRNKVCRIVMQHRPGESFYYYTVSSGYSSVEYFDNVSGALSEFLNQVDSAFIYATTITDTLRVSRVSLFERF